MTARVGTGLQSRIAAGEFPPAPTTPQDLLAFARDFQRTGINPNSLTPEQIVEANGRHRGEHSETGQEELGLHQIAALQNVAFERVRAWLARMVASGFSADKIVAELPGWLDRMTRQP